MGKQNAIALHLVKQTRQRYKRRDKRNGENIAKGLTIKVALWLCDQDWIWCCKRETPAQNGVAIITGSTLY